MVVPDEVEVGEGQTQKTIRNCSPISGSWQKINCSSCAPPPGSAGDSPPAGHVVPPRAQSTWLGTSVAE